MIRRTWLRLNRLPPLIRAPLKLACFLLVVGLALYPRVWLLPEYIERIRDMNSVLDPENPGLAPIEAEVRQMLGWNTNAESKTNETASSQKATTPIGPAGGFEMGAARPGTDPKLVAAVVQAVVDKHVPYAFDWDTRSVMDHLPTVAEVLAMGRDDCDGRAVVAASLLRRMGYRAWLVSDIVHTWVQTEEFETMNPRPSPKAFVATEHGTTAGAPLAIAENLAHGVGFGATVFPIVRQLIIVAALVVLSLQPRSAIWRRIVGAVLPFAALLTVFWLGPVFGGGEKTPVWIVGAAFAAMVLGWGLLMIRPRERREVAQRDEPLSL